MGKKMILQVTRREFVERYTDLCVGVFDLTKKEVLILNELQIYYLEYKDSEMNQVDVDLLMATKLDSVKETLSINDFGFRKHIRNLKKKDAIFVENSSLRINSFLIPTKEFTIEFYEKEREKGN